MKGLPKHVLCHNLNYGTQPEYTAYVLKRCYMSSELNIRNSVFKYNGSGV